MKIQEHIEILIVHEGEPAQLCPGQFDPAATFTLHTHGMDAFDRPELCVRGVPAPYVNSMGAFLNHWAAYSVKNQILDGQTLSRGGPIMVVYRAVTSALFKGTPTLCLVPAWLQPPSTGNDISATLH